MLFLWLMQRPLQLLWRLTWNLLFSHSSFFLPRAYILHNHHEKSLQVFFFFLWESYHCIYRGWDQWQHYTRYRLLLWWMSFLFFQVRSQQRSDCLKLFDHNVVSYSEQCLTHAQLLHLFLQEIGIHHLFWGGGESFNEISSEFSSSI